ASSHPNTSLAGGRREDAWRWHWRVVVPGNDFKSRRGSMEALKIQFAYRRRVNPPFDNAERPLAYHDLAPLCLVAKSRREIGHASDSRIFEAAVKSNLPERGVTKSDSNSKPETVSAATPILGKLADSV